MKKELENPDLKVTGFIGDTLVHLRGDEVGENRFIAELREIQFVGVGDNVLSRCEKTGETAYREVVKKFRHHGDIPRYCVTYHVNDNQKIEGVDVTAQHPFWVQGRGWTVTVDLQPGDIIASCEGNLLTVKMVHLYDYSLEIFNLAVAEFHTYFVDVEGLWVQDKAAD